jgi:hypothetical protein
MEHENLNNQENAQLGIGAVMPRLSRKAVLQRDNQIITDLEQLKVEARNRDDEATAQKLDGVIFRLLCLTNEA